MATKKEPGEFDCYANAKDDEPMFVLLARDKSGPAAVRYWCLDRIKTGKNRIDDPQIKDAYACATAMETWQAEQTVPQPERAAAPDKEPAAPVVDTL